MISLRFALAVLVLVVWAAASRAGGESLANYDLNTMRGYGKCTVELENGPIEFFHESFDGSHRSGFATSNDATCRLVAHLSDPIDLHAIAVSFFGADDLGGVEWTLSELDDKGAVKRVVLSHRTTVIEEPETVTLEEPARLKDFAFEFTKLLEDMSPAPRGRMSFRIGELDLLVPNGAVIYVATPNEKWLFEPGFYPFETVVGREIQWTGWSIGADGARTRTVEGVKFTSSDPSVARMDGAMMETLEAGTTTVRAVGPSGSHEVPVVVRPQGRGGFDLDVIRITRLVLNEETGEWEVLSRRGDKPYPARGDTVRYRAEVINLGQDAARRITVVWTIDGEFAKAGELSALEPAGPLVGSGEYLTSDKVNELMVHAHRAFFDLDITWRDGRQSIGFAVNANAARGGRGELNPDNNHMTIVSDALCFAYYTTELGYHRFTNSQQEGLKAGGVPEATQREVAAKWGKRAAFWRTEPAVLSSSIYDYIARTCRAWDDQCAISVYPLTPGGVTTRFRSKVVIIRDPASAWQAWGEGGGRAVWSDTETDVSWGWVADATFPWDNVMNAAFVRKNYQDCGFMFFDAPMLHEASHAHGLVDLYVCPMKNDEVMWQDADGKRLWPDDRGGICDMRRRWTRYGPLVGEAVMMDGNYVDGYSEHSAYAMERMATKRGRYIPCNNCSGNASFGDFFNDVAFENVLELWTVHGEPVVGAKIEISKRVDRTGIADDVAEISGFTDEKGQFNMGNNPVDWPDNTAPVPRDIPFATAYYQLHPLGATGSDHAVIRITTKDGKRSYKFLNSFDLNLAYWYAYGLEPNGWPISSPRPYTRVIIAFTIDPALNEQEAAKMENAGEVPTFGLEPPFGLETVSDDAVARPEYEKIQAWRRRRDAPKGSTVPLKE